MTNFLLQVRYGNFIKIELYSSKTLNYSLCGVLYFMRVELGFHMSNTPSLEKSSMERQTRARLESNLCKKFISFNPEF